MDTIALGRHNPRLTQIRKATQRGALTEDGLLPIDGPNLLREAVQAGLETNAIFLREGTPCPTEAANSRTFVLDAASFKSIQATEHSQGVVALVRLRHWDLAQVVKPDGGGPILVLVELQDPGNVGAILRAAEAFGAAGCLGLQGTCSAYNSKVVRASAGSVFRLPHVWDLTWADALSALTRASIPLVGTSPHARTSITSWNWNQTTALLIGNEGSGLSPERLAACTATLSIPQRAPVESLNSAVAAAVILYEAWRRRSES